MLRGGVHFPERWRAIGLTASLEEIGLFELVKDQDIADVCETPEEQQLLNEFVREFMVLRKFASDIDNYVFTIVGNNMGENNYTPYWNKVGEYCKLRLFGYDQLQTEKRIKTWHISSGFDDCERLWGMLEKDSILTEFNHRLGSSQAKCKQL